MENKIKHKDLKYETNIYIYIYIYLIFNNLKQWDLLVIVFILVDLVQWGRNGSNGSIK